MENITVFYRRKFRSQTSDNMDRWKSRGGKSQRREEQKREDQRRERVRRKKMQVREKVATSRNTVFFPMICGSGGSKSRHPWYICIHLPHPQALPIKIDVVLLLHTRDGIRLQPQKTWRNIWSERTWWWTSHESSVGSPQLAQQGR